ncbi:Nitrogen fixation-related protein [Paramagnetospirillum magnetotacticum MS-1]|uniref:Nitrogen fixation-related protein n=1 Tax=Paramagnetospirillum magnetotacticum MS-1 TaxID=272627 RepID=A0A0C2YYX1_PARME|nr:NifB/NifX family molybdenum-iron cluster-binding protein [Paramagnetospirillum magnetotacticum]KIL99870.1 Nitrogen fixation-related protein [Paramagnetospirillum magnetotacticum MS-1]
MKIAVAVDSSYAKVSGHAGRARHWLVYETDRASSSVRVELEAAQVFHHYEGDGPHPLDGIETVIAISAGEGFMRRMQARGIDARQTAETNPDKAVADYLAECLSAPKPRPIGALLCKTLDLFSKHK